MSYCGILPAACSQGHIKLYKSPRQMSVWSLYPIRIMENNLDAMQNAEEIIANFELIDDWEERYRYLIELGQEMEPLSPSEHNASNKVLGCASQVWLKLTVEGEGAESRLRLSGDSDAHIVRGLVALMVALYSGKTLEEALAVDPVQILARIGLEQHLTPQRSNGLRSMVQRIRHDTQAAIAAIQS